MTNNYYVYQHLDETGAIVYIGKGRYDRAWLVFRGNPEHAAWLKTQYPRLNVQFVATDLEEQDALKKERQLIKALQPKFNLFYTDRDSKRLIDQGKWLATEKSRFSESELQSELGKRAAQCRKHPNNVMHTCPHCRKTMNLGHIRRYHGDNCKRRVEQ